MAVRARLVIAENDATYELPIGPESIMSIDSDLSASVDGSEVAVDVCEAVINADTSVNQGSFITADDEIFNTVLDEIFCVGIDTQILPLIPAGTEVKYIEGTNLIGLWYIDSVTRVGKTMYKLGMISAFGLLDDVPHAGDIYTGQSFEDVLAEIIDGKFDYVIGNPVAEVNYGPNSMIRYAAVDQGVFIDTVGGVEGHYDFYYYGTNGDGIWIDGELRKGVWVNSTQDEVVSLSTYGISTLQTPAAQTSNGEASVGVWYYNRSDLSDVTVYGWLPYSNARDNLHTLLFACGVNILRDYKGRPRFDFLASGDIISVPGTEIYAEGSVVQGAAVTSVAVTEHSWVQEPSSESEVLFDNSGTGIAVQNVIVVFREPYFELTQTGDLVIVESGVNYAKLSGVGTLTGKKYRHDTRIARRESGAANALRQKEPRVDDCTLITGLNSNKILDRLVDYYTKSKKLTGRMIYNVARPGSMVSMLNAFGEPENAIISKMQLVSSATLAATFEAIANFHPKGGGNDYSHRIVFTSSQTWSPPPDVDRVRLVLIGGGQGGQSGGNGHLGWGRMGEGEQGKGGAGGVGGHAGSSGKTIIVDVDITGSTSFAFAIGDGGAGGEALYETKYPGQPQEYNYGVSGAAPVDGAEGTATTVTYGTQTISSDNGTVLSGGYVDILTGEIYALQSNDVGRSGANGGDSNQYGDSIQLDESGTVWRGGESGSPYSGTLSGQYAYGGGGGGAALNGHNGSSGKNAAWDAGSQMAYGGGGGLGANATARDLDGVETRRGVGGYGGYGSGGGGASGFNPQFRFAYADAGEPGIGGKGGTGAKGLAMAYY